MATTTQETTMFKTFALGMEGPAPTEDDALVLRFGAGETPYVHAGTYFEDEATRDAVVALFPKSTKVKPSTLSSWNRETGESRRWPSITFDVRFERNGVTGEFNESGLARWRSFKRAAAKAGLVVREDTIHTASMDEFEATLGVVA